ncbi:MAG: hypothetical protein WBA89_05135 [Microcoleus sp.]|uniref:hypothetical protein n=1 Tax=Microcoleus sp. TaxID=44472 RepID=UPI003C75005D
MRCSGGTPIKETGFLPDLPAAAKSFRKNPVSVSPSVPDDLKHEKIDALALLHQKAQYLN